ncbi:cyclic nucleotide-binding domain-containing protein, partial [Mycobacterium avium]
MDEILTRSAIFRGVEPGAESLLTEQLQHVHFPRGYTVFAEHEPADRLYIIVSGKVKVGGLVFGEDCVPARKVDVLQLLG